MRAANELVSRDMGPNGPYSISWQTIDPCTRYFSINSVINISGIEVSLLCCSFDHFSSLGFRKFITAATPLDSIAPALHFDVLLGSLPQAEVEILNVYEITGCGARRNSLCGVKRNTYLTHFHQSNCLETLQACVVMMTIQKYEIKNREGRNNYPVINKYNP